MTVQALHLMRRCPSDTQTIHQISPPDIVTIYEIRLEICVVWVLKVDLGIVDDTRAEAFRQLHAAAEDVALAAAQHTCQLQRSANAARYESSIHSGGQLIVRIDVAEFHRYSRPPRAGLSTHAAGVKHRVLP